MNVDEGMVLIKWHDAKFYPGIRRKDDILEHKMDTYESLGYLTEQNN